MLNKGTDVKFVQASNMLDIFVTDVVVNNGTDTNARHSLNMLDIFATEDVLNNGTVSIAWHPLNMPDISVTDDVVNKGMLSIDLQFKNILAVLVTVAFVLTVTDFNSKHSANKFAYEDKLLETILTLSKNNGRNVGDDDPVILIVVKLVPEIAISNQGMGALVVKFVLVNVCCKSIIVKLCPACGVTVIITCLYPADVSVPLDIEEYVYLCEAFVLDVKFSAADPSPQSTV